jgi:hypothetical protein
MQRNNVYQPAKKEYKKIGRMKNHPSLTIAYMRKLKLYLLEKEIFSK